jgi:ArsR family transcriptional regulator
MKIKQSGCSQVLKALSDPTRLAVLEILLEKETYVSEFIDYLNIEPTLLSHHLSILRGEGLIKANRRGKTVLYKLVDGVKIKGKNKGLNLGKCRLVFLEKTKKSATSARKKTKKGSRKKTKR